MPPEAGLIIFTRYPEPGKAKTRLIPALGPAGAAELHRQLAERTVTQARLLQQSQAVGLVVRFAGGTVQDMQSWLGEDLVCRPQGAGDLGDRLTEACETAFAEGRSPLLVIGTDCPELGAPLLAQALVGLNTHDLVLGPAADGGYYLIGLRRLMPELFQDIAWSTHQVLGQTVAIATRLQLAIAYLPTLRDIDRPEDLPYLKTLNGRD